ncbi:MAG: DUF624 domain-containing protein [Lachnospiraceae bacterium]|jgi:uncharacterized membrane protein YesL|nr:DUF624 domain-containing protein [Lachnospiraceae bacterium]
MGGFFSLDSPAMVFLSRVADLMLLNLLVMVMCLPVITIGPTLTAMHYVLLKMARKEEGYLFGPFMKSFKANFKIATLCWLIMLALIAVFIIDMEIINNSGLEFARWLRTALYAVLVIGVMTGIYVFPLLARFENNIRNTFKNALYMSIINLPKTALMIVIYLIPLAMLYLSLNILPIVFLLGISVPSYMCAKLYSNVFKRFEPEEEPIDADSWTVNMED